MRRFAFVCCAVLLTHALLAADRTASAATISSISYDVTGGDFGSIWPLYTGPVTGGSLIYTPPGGSVGTPFNCTAMIAPTCGRLDFVATGPSVTLTPYITQWYFTLYSAMIDPSHLAGTFSYLSYVGLVHGAINVTFGAGAVHSGFYTYVTVSAATYTIGNEIRLPGGPTPTPTPPTPTPTPTPAPTPEAIPLINGSFETPIIVDGGEQAMSHLEILNPAPPDWQATVGSGAQVFHADGSDGHFTGTSGAPGTLPGTADGQQYMWIFTINAFSFGRLDYVPPISALANTKYTLTAAVGQRKTDTEPGGRIDVVLMLEGAQVAITTLNEVVAGIPNDTFVDVSTSFTTGAGDAGKPLGIRLWVFGFGGVAFDNIRLVKTPHTPTPTPATPTPPTPTPATPTPTPLPDVDGDGVPDISDNCPFVPNEFQENADSLPAGDACQCGDVDNDDSVTAADVARAQENLVGAPLGGTFIATRCNVIGPSDGGVSDCDIADIFVLRRFLAGSPVTVENACDAYSPGP